jgi:hypothetical protein
MNISALKTLIGRIDQQIGAALRDGLPDSVPLGLPDDLFDAASIGGLMRQRRELQRQLQQLEARIWKL